MKISTDVLDILCDDLLNFPEYRDINSLVDFMNKFGFRDSYDKVAKTRGEYALQRLINMNGTNHIDDVIKEIYNPLLFANQLDRLSELDNKIRHLNSYLFLDHAEIERRVDILSVYQIDEEFNRSIVERETKFDQDFANLDLSRLAIENKLTRVIENRLDELKICLDKGLSLSAIFLIGSIFEGLLTGYADKHREIFLKSKKAPKDKDGKTLLFDKWSLIQLVEVAVDEGLIKKNIEDFGKVLWNYRNYIHPAKQVSSDFELDEPTADICWNILKTTIIQLSDYCKNHE